MPGKKQGIASSWVALKLDLNPELIEVDLGMYQNRKSWKDLMKQANKVHLIHNKLEKILFGSLNIRMGEKLFLGCGYEAQEFKDYVERVTNHNNP